MVIARRLAFWNRPNFTRQTACRSEMLTFSLMYFFLVDGVEFNNDQPTRSTFINLTTNS